MTATPKTIQIFLPAGDPQGIRVAEITTRIVQVLEVPRSLISEFLKMPESHQVAVYYLIGEAEDGSGTVVYIGQTGDLRKRLPSHQKEKGFWERALILISRTQSLTQTHALLLEWHSIQKVREAGRYSDENGNSGSKPYTPPPLEADCMEIFDAGNILLSTLGFPLFDPLVKPSTGAESDNRYFCQGSGANGIGMHTSEGFVVLKGSTGRRENVPSMEGTTTKQAREKVIASDAVRVDGDTIIFEKDYLFPSPSTAAITLMGRTANGWTEWKNHADKTLDEVERSQSNQDPEQ